MYFANALAGAAFASSSDSWAEASRGQPNRERRGGCFYRSGSASPEEEEGQTHRQCGDCNPFPSLPPRIPIQLVRCQSYDILRIPPSFIQQRRAISWHRGRYICVISSPLTRPLPL